MQFLKTIVAVAAIAASAGSMAGTSLGNVSATNDYVIGGSSVKPVFGSNFYDGISFTLLSDAFVRGYATGATAPAYASTLGFAYLYANGSPFEIAYDSNANDGFDFGYLTAGSYGIVFAGVEQNSMNRGNYAGLLTVSSVPEPETYAMMLAGLGAIGFMARRRRAS